MAIGNNSNEPAEPTIRFRSITSDNGFVFALGYDGHIYQYDIRHRNWCRVRPPNPEFFH